MNILNGFDFSKKRNKLVQNYSKLLHFKANLTSKSRGKTIFKANISDRQ